MKLLYILGIILLFNQCDYMTKVKEPNVRIQVKVVDKLELDKFKDLGCTFYSANIELLNNTDRLIKFWSMNCSWQDNWISTSDSLSLFNEGCTRNFPKIYQINPKNKVVYKSIICVKGSVSDMKERNIKLGFVLINELEISKDSEFEKVLSMKIKEQKDIIWSESFKIDM